MLPAAHLAGTIVYVPLTTGPTNVHHRFCLPFGFAYSTSNVAAVVVVIAVVLGASGDDIVAILSAHVKTQTTTFCLHWRAAAVAASCGGPWQDVCGGGGGGRGVAAAAACRGMALASRPVD